MTRITTANGYDNKDNLLILIDSPASPKLQELLTDDEWTQVKNAEDQKIDCCLLPESNRAKFVLFLPKHEDSNRRKELVRRAAAKAIKTFHKIKATTVFIKNFGEIDFSLECAEALALSNYQFLKYFKNKKEKKHALENIVLDEQSVNAAEANALQYLTEGTCEARTLINEPLSFLTATQLSEEIKRMGKEAGFSVEVFEKEKIEEMKMGGLLAVNRGSFTPPTFNIMEWKPENAKNSKPVILVGKGIVFDTGGLSLKPTANSMDFMKADMGGAATVIGTMYAVSKAKLPIHIVGLVPATDNRPGNNAYAPGDVIKMYSGSTVEVLNTDAEGRMVLADALHYAKQYNPELVFDFATLTGAAAVLLGGQGISLMGNAAAEVKSQMIESGYRVHERLLELPMWDEFGEMMKSDIADLKNIGGRMAGAITAGKFLEHFTDYPWLHLDIAGNAFKHKSDSYRGKNGTGVGVRLMFDFFRNYMKNI